MSDSSPPKVRRVSLFKRDGAFETYVHVAGTPRVVTFEGRAYVAFDSFSTTNSFRECDQEEGAK